MITTMVDLAVDLAALEHNYHQLRRLCDSQVKMLAVVKADAYGHGLLPVARKLAAAGRIILGVGSLEEGLMLRQAKISLPVLLLWAFCRRKPNRRWPAAWRCPCSAWTWPRPWPRRPPIRAKRPGGHLKVDTGMGRLGVLPQEVLPFLAALKKMRHLKVMGLISHLAVADQADKTYTHKQLQEFTALLAAARAEGFKLPLSHISNSAALWELPEAHVGLVRPGLMLYGSAPSPDRPPPVELKPVMSLAARVLQVKRLPPGTSISYGCTYTTPDWCDLAVLPVGYCNGYSRLGSNRGDGSHPWPPGPHPGPGVHEPHHGGRHRLSGGQGGRPGRVPGPGPGGGPGRRGPGRLGPDHQL